jgi:hypothetical protein
VPGIKHTVLAAIATLVFVQGSAAAQVVINEVRTDQPQTDNDEYIELAGPGGTNIQDLTIIILGDAFLDPGTGLGGSGSIEAIIPLAAPDGETERTIPNDGYLLIAESTFSLGGGVDLETDLRLENNDNITIFLVRDYADLALGHDLDADDNGLLDFEDESLVDPPPAPWAAALDIIAIIEEDNPPQAPDGEFHYGPPTVGPNGVFAPGYVYRCADGDPAGTFLVGGFDPADAEDTPGAENDCGDPGAPDAGPTIDMDGGVEPAPDAGDVDPGAPDAGTVVPPEFPAFRRDRPGIFCQVGNRNDTGSWLLIGLSLAFIGFRRRRS